MTRMTQANYKNLHLLLFRHISKALEAMEELDFGRAKNLLIEGQIKAEETYLEYTDPR